MFKSTIRRLSTFSNLKQCQPLIKSTPTILHNSEQRNFSSTNLVSHQPRTTIEALNIIVEAEKNYDLGKIEFNNKNFAKALEYFKIAESIEPTNPSIMVEVAASLASLGKLQEAADLCDEIIKKYQTVPKIRERYGENLLGRALFLCGEFHLKMSKFESAIIYYNSLKNHEALIANYRIGQCNVLLGKFKEAIEYFTIIIEQYADASDYEFTDEPGEDTISLSYFGRGVCYGELNEYQNAIDDFTNYINTTQSGFRLLDVLGRRSLIFEKKGQLEEAYQDIRTRTILTLLYEKSN